ncbi:hypothetical protein BBK36DRAFT_1142559 [Trichoderma citrinoviride]|uniref:Uncharacterized protein n=1 Tax=Trichoderma citrinoviride TaxID=58853 RepID=A0A2T4B5L7_9HYPO|nr:hypothetical protein BBK36DRAFT_1142559 [Trichoderma citrinoviride]PTB64614.1 hypothetical protein BBK36DRAFT_1142559 [Trichoderma citrinoviride]
MIGLAYTAFVVPIPNADEYNDFVTNLPLSPALKGRLSTSSSRNSNRFSFGSFTSDLFLDDDTHDYSPSTNYNNNEDDDDGGNRKVKDNNNMNEIGSGNDDVVIRRRKSKRASVLRRLRVLVDERVSARLRRRNGYAPVGDDEIEMH